MLMFLFYYCICAFLCGCHSFNPSLYRLSPLLLSYVAVSKPCRLPEFYPHRALNKVDKGPFSGFATFKSLFIYFIHSFIYLFQNKVMTTVCTVGQVTHCRLGNGLCFWHFLVFNFHRRRWFLLFDFCVHSMTVKNNAVNVMNHIPCMKRIEFHLKAKHDDHLIQPTVFKYKIPSKGNQTIVKK